MVSGFGTVDGPRGKPCGKRNDDLSPDADALSLLPILLKLLLRERAGDGRRILSWILLVSSRRVSPLLCRRGSRLLHRVLLVDRGGMVGVNTSTGSFCMSADFAVATIIVLGGGGVM